MRALFQTGGVLTSQDAQRLNSAIYVEARALLRPSLESFDRAVEAASLQGAMTGNLLELVRLQLKASHFDSETNPQ